MRRAIWWIRRDLRLVDNQALQRALDMADEVLPLFIIDRRLVSSAYAGARRVDFLMDGLCSLDADLRTRGSRLIVREGVPAEVLGRLCHEECIDAIIAEQDVSPFARERDGRVARELGDRHVEFVEGRTIRPLGTVRKDDGKPYTVFTPYSRRWRRMAPVMSNDLIAPPRQLTTPADVDSMPMPGQSGGTGERQAALQLEQFVAGPPPSIYSYAQHRDRPDLNGTSALSPYLRFGMISPRAAAAKAYAAIQQAPTEEARTGAETWLSELIWRDFYADVLFAFPHVRRRSFQTHYERIEWETDREAFGAWCSGRTGYPFVDAAMRQLLATGWMHNRARMVTASFLVKDLLIDWRWGERWFMQQLLDGDPAANNGGWQWSAGTGTDAAPYFRIFNPVSQGKTFDPDGVYIRKWVPELANVPKRRIHEPWKMTTPEQVQSGCTVGSDYPHPIVDHAWARQRTLDAFKKARGTTA